MPTAIEIFKHLPKKNCGECKFPTCLAFAMQLANNKAKLDDCPADRARPHRGRQERGGHGGRDGAVPS